MESPKPTPVMKPIGKPPYTWADIAKYFPKGWDYVTAFQKTTEQCIKLKLIKRNDKTKQPKVY